MVNQTLARRYAIAVATLAREQEAVARVSEDLQMLAGAFGAPGLANDFFESPVIDRPSKERVLAEAVKPGAGGGGADWDRVARLLVDAISGLLLAPVSIDL